MRFRDYFSSKAISLCFLGIGALLLAVFLNVAGTPLPLLLLVEAFLVLLVFLWLLCSFFVESRRMKKLRRIEEELEQKYLLGEVLPAPANLLERQYYEMMKVVSRSAIGMAEQAQREKEEYCTYVESWIHEIKTPLTACSLILSNGGDTRKLRQELKRADNLTENILYYARMRTPEKDTIIQRIAVASVLDEAVKSQMELLIAAKVSVELQGDFEVCTDAKQLCFIIKQLLVNCAKYCPGCCVMIIAAQGSIVIEDNGPGIPPHELPRVTERGFTGTTGRKMSGSTGMGLYIVSELCKQMGVAFELESKQGLFTRAKLSFDSLTKL